MDESEQIPDSSQLLRLGFSVEKPVLEAEIFGKRFVADPDLAVPEKDGWRLVLKKDAKNLKKTSAGKTGTTNDCTDAWFIGYTPDIICGVWVCFDIKKSLGKDATGGKIACPIWTEFMKLALKDTPNKDFIKPANIIEVLVDKDNGLLASDTSKRVYTETFIQGTEPKEFSTLETEVSSSTTISEPSIYEEINSGF
jgi:membrane carboxypeptidase/penicillin-binding protein